MPPSPKELTPARRGVAARFHGVALDATKKGESAKLIFGLGVAEIQAWRDGLVLQRQRRLDQARCGCARIEMADVGLHRAQGAETTSSVEDRNARVSPSTSIGSPRMVPVPCASISETVSAVDAGPVVGFGDDARLAGHAGRHEAGAASRRRC